MEHQAAYIRKRKQPELGCNCAQELQDIRRDIALLLQRFTDTQETTMNFMRENMAEMKSQLNDIKVSNDSLNKEQTAMKTKISDLTVMATATENKILSIESEIKTIKNKNVIEGTSAPGFDENIMRELQERATREKNVIVVGIPECKTMDSDEGRTYDASEVYKVLSNMIQDCPKPSRVLRLGKPNPAKDRNIKVCFESAHTAKLLLRNKNTLQSDIKLYSDQTPAQQSYMKELKNELERRITNGESDITIKYVKGVPKIVSSRESKN